MRRRIVFIVPGELDSLTGGYGYDRQVIAGLREAGWVIEVLVLDASYPWPGEQARAQAAVSIAAIPDGTVVVVDGLAFGALPELAELHARRLLWVALVHHPLAHETGLTTAQRDQLAASERRALAAARAVIVTSAFTARSLVADFQVVAGRITVVLPGTEVAPSPKRLAGLIREDDVPGGLSLLCVATLTPRKGHECLIDALAGLKDRPWTLHCVGSLSFSPATVASVRAAIDRQGLQGRVCLHGEVSADALSAFHGRADLFVLPSFFEGYGMALAEALAHGLPVCSTTAGAIPDTVPADAGVLVPAGDVPALRGALARLIDEPGWRATLARGARRAGGDLPTWTQAASLFAQTLERIKA
ncbi:glycosyltransferase family 4 protein [Aquabacterium sp.]|uniref:glycosyltransferase family 4 protein n=1 Tax=Aquabacterium sp. TaxID=1872578 RepID=UPI003D6D2A7B